MTRSYAFDEGSKQKVDLGPNSEKLVPIAQDIAIHRAEMVAACMFHMAAIRSLQQQPGTGQRALVTCVKAHVQTSTAEGGQQAAHLLPGQICVNGQPVWALARTNDNALKGAVERVATQTQMCFAWTNVLPASFNRADSQAEGTGHGSATAKLKPIFGDVVQAFWRTAQVDPRGPLVIDRKATLGALEAWFHNVSAVYRAAAATKTSRNRTEEALVLTTYADSFKVVNVGRFVEAHVPHVSRAYVSLS